MRSRACAKANRMSTVAAIMVLASVPTTPVATTSTTGLVVPQTYRLISTSTPPTPPTPLIANDQGYVRVITVSQAIGCSISPELVACETSSDDWPPRGNGRPFHTVSVSADGNFQFVDADLGALAGKVELKPGTYQAQGWSVVATGDSFVFTNDRTGHGMQVSTQVARPL